MGTPRITRLIVFTSQHCPHCRKLERDGVVAKLRKLRPDLEITRYDLTKGATDTSEFYGVRVIPAFVVVDGDGHGVSKVAGPRTAEQLAKLVG